MKTKKRVSPLSEKEIDDLVVAQANKDTAWAQPVLVRQARLATVSLSADLAARAGFFARLHRESSIETWISKVLQERLDLEVAAFTGVKREIAQKAYSEHAILQKHCRRLARQTKALITEQAPM
jgi:hypothetical protein